MVWFMTTTVQCVSITKVNMCFIKYSVFIISLYFLNCCALNCRSDGGPKEEELNSVYKNCLKKQEGKNSSDSRRYSDDQDWDEPRGYNQRNQWDRDGRSGRDKNRDDRGSNRDRTRNRDNRMGGRDDKMGGRDDKMEDRDEKIGNREGMMGNREDRMGYRHDARDPMEGRENRMSGRNDGMGRKDQGGMGYHEGDTNRYNFNGRDDFSTDEYGGDMSRHNFYTSTQPSRRFRRDRHKEINSGHRSQYNPNAHKTEHEDVYRDERNSTKNSSKDEENKACALHCFLEHLEMIGDNGMPDKYLVTHVLTKDVKNEDLRDFLQESIEECFQILDNENKEDKCDFSKNLMMCLSEKGRANCDDWKDDLKF